MGDHYSMPSSVKKLTLYTMGGLIGEVSEISYTVSSCSQRQLEEKSANDYNIATAETAIHPLF